MLIHFFFFFQAEDGIRDVAVTGVQTCALPIWFDSAVSLKIAERSPAVDPLPVPVRCAKSGSSNDGRLRGSLGTGRDRSAVISVLARSSCCSCSEIGRASCRERV